MNKIWRVKAALFAILSIKYILMSLKAIIKEKATGINKKVWYKCSFHNKRYFLCRNSATLQMTNDVCSISSIEKWFLTRYGCTTSLITCFFSIYQKSYVFNKLRVKSKMTPALISKKLVESMRGFSMHTLLYISRMQNALKRVQSLIPAFQIMT